MGENFTNKHRYFIQFMLQNGTVSQKDALTFLTEISQDQNTLRDIKNLISDINREIVKQSFKIAPTYCEITGEEVFVWINTKNDSISLLQTGFSKVELEYFHAVMQEIIGSEDHGITYPCAMNIASTLKATLSREAGQNTLMKWFDGGYFVKKDEFVYLGPRTIIEFKAYLKANAENFTCKLCSEQIFVGETCMSCQDTFHLYCLQKFRQLQATCPNCKTAWATPEAMEVSQESESSQIE